MLSTSNQPKAPHVPSAGFLLLFVIGTTIAVDMFNLGIVYPLFTEMVADPAGILGATLSPMQRFTIYSLLIAVFPFMQFLCAPVLGKLSDHRGRRPVLLGSIAGGVIGLAITAMGAQQNSLFWILLGRAISGAMGANMSLAYATLADCTEGSQKVRAFSIIPLVCCIGFSAGPLTASYLVSSNPLSGAGFAVALWAAVLLTLFNLGIVALFFHPAPPVQTSNVSTRNKRAFSLPHPSLRKPLFIVLLMISANFLLIQFIGPFTSERLGAGLSQVAGFYVLQSAAVAAGHLFITRPLANRYTPQQLLAPSLLLLALFSGLLALSQSTVLIYLTLIPAMLCCAVAYTNCMTHLSNQAASEAQGEAMGLGVSAQCIAEFLPPLCIGAVTSIWIAAPMYFAALLALGAFVLCRVSIPEDGFQEVPVRHPQ